MSSITKTTDKPDMIVRKMPFEFPNDIDPHWNPDKPEWSHMVNGTSLAMPFLEPYLIRTMRKSLPLIDSGTLKEDVKLYIGQEGQHFQQHRKFNDLLIEKGYAELTNIERQMKQEFDDFEKNRSHKFNLAYAAGFESMALGVAHWLINDREYLFGHADSRVASLVLWHFVEEIEHKNVAIDAYNAVYGHYFYRVYGVIFATLHVIKHSRRAYQAMLKKDGLWNNLRSRWKLLKMTTRFFRNMLPPMIVACLPGHHPSQVKDPQWSLDWIARYDSNTDEFAILDTTNISASFS
ncbi:metal-dependent hydrolase [Maricurvus nonylphenolicus]|uniref:metal-dependent hydrolase n=1 Tax=Maricurvus nonylphenolicus TaxID=1008307 RepID=UPI0036F34F21